jgi:hypothetical protein
MAYPAVAPDGRHAVRRAAAQHSDLKAQSQSIL